MAAAFPSSVKDKVILITGVNKGGIGGATAKALAAHQPRLLILAGRSPEKVNAVIADIQATRRTVACRFLLLDLSSPASVRAAAATVIAYQEPLHLLINNGAVMDLPTRTLSTEGFELQFATNFLGPFLLTNLLLPKLLQAVLSSPSNSVRLINLSSSAHFLGPVRFSDLNFTSPNESVPQEEQYPTSTLDSLGLLLYDKNYVPMAAYAQSKTAIILFTRTLNRRLVGKGIHSFCLHPGSVSSELQRHSDPKVLDEARKKFGSNIPWKTIDEGASTTLVAALDPKLDVAEGEAGYLSDCQFAEPAEWCQGEKGRAAAERLWGEAQKIVGEKFEW